VDGDDGDSMCTVPDAVSTNKDSVELPDPDVEYRVVSHPLLPANRESCSGGVGGGCLLGTNADDTKAGGGATCISRGLDDMAGERPKFANMFKLELGIADIAVLWCCEYGGGVGVCECGVFAHSIRQTQ
jgi:hypothetical protein